MCKASCTSEFNARRVDIAFNTNCHSRSTPRPHRLQRRLLCPPLPAVPRQLSGGCGTFRKTVQLLPSQVRAFSLPFSSPLHLSLFPILRLSSPKGSPLSVPLWDVKEITHDCSLATRRHVSFPRLPSQRRIDDRSQIVHLLSTDLNSRSCTGAGIYLRGRERCVMGGITAVRFLFPLKMKLWAYEVFTGAPPCPARSEQASANHKHQHATRECSREHPPPSSIAPTARSTPRFVVPLVGSRCLSTPSVCIAL